MVWGCNSSDGTGSALLILPELKKMIIEKETMPICKNSLVMIIMHTFI